MTPRAHSDGLDRGRRSPRLVSAFLALGTVGTAIGQTSPLVDPLSEPAPTTTFETRQIPVGLPWLSASTPDLPDWVDTPYVPMGPLLRPGLGSAAFGDNPLQPVAAIRRGGRGPSPIPLGPIDVGFDVSYGMTYGTGLVGRGNQNDEASFRNTLTPAISLFAGDRWSLRYAPTASFFSADGFDDTLDHAVRLQGSASAPGWEFGLSHATSISSPPLIETARQTDQTIHATGVNGNWDVNGKDALSFSLSQNLRFADGTPDMVSWANQNWYNRPLTDNIAAGLGIGFGYDLMDPGTDMVSERFNGRVSGRLGPKISYSISGGAELRQFVGSDASTKVSPLVAATITYQVLQRTSFFVGLDHSVDTSFFTDQLTQNTSVNAGVTQILTERWTASVSGGYRLSDYQSTLTNDLSTREDSTTYANVSLVWQALRRLSVALSYSYRSNASDQANFDFDSHQLGFRMNYSI